MSFGKSSFSGENSRDTLDLQTGVETIDCMSKNANPDPIIELRIDDQTVDAASSSCSGDRNSV